MSLVVSYQGWSGFTVRTPEIASLPAVLIDPIPDVASTEEPAVVLVTHGHPEHVQGALALLRRPDRARLKVFGAKPVCRFLKTRSFRYDDEFASVAPGDVVTVEGWRVRVFEWDHMPLLPESWNSKLDYLGRLLSHPLELANIAAAGITGPSHKPMLGFTLEVDESSYPSLIYFGEGLHRRTTTRRLQGAFGDATGHRGAVLIAAIEPEDVLAVPSILESRALSEVLAFEAHQEWRSRFGLRQVDRREFSTRMKEAGLPCRVLTPGEQTLFGA